MGKERKEGERRRGERERKEDNEKIKKLFNKDFDS